MIFIFNVNNVHFSLFVRLDNSIIIEAMYKRLGLSRRILDEPGHAHPQATTPSAAIFIVIIVDHGVCSSGWGSRLGWCQSYTEGNAL